MPITVYNTLSRKKEEFLPGNPPLVTFYVCGPTVYDYIHIGNARVFVVFDVVRRHLKSRGFEVQYIQNYTDIDDKMIRRAAEEGVSVPELAARFITAYEEDAAALRVQPADVRPRATEHIAQIIALIERLLERGYAYRAGGDVYFDTSRYTAYGRLSHQDPASLQAGARIEPGENKRAPLDFVLWKARKAGEPHWSSPWGEGRPGWHIECSAMSTHYHDDTLDIHAGGVDLVFPHHENEIAQTWGADGRELARCWMHAGYLNFESQKMSKSLGNVRTVRELLAGHDPLDLRLLLLSAHYRSPLNFSADLVQSSRTGRLRLEEMAANVQDALERAAHSTDTGPAGQALAEALIGAESRFQAAMDDDFNTADALGVLFELARSVNSYLREAEHSASAPLSEVLAFYRRANAILEVMNLKERQNLDDDVAEKIARREEARVRRDWAAADAIRDELLTGGIVIEDTPHGPRWKSRG